MALTTILSYQIDVDNRLISVSEVFIEAFFSYHLSRTWQIYGGVLKHSHYPHAILNSLSFYEDSYPSELTQFFLLITLLLHNHLVYLLMQDG